MNKVRMLCYVKQMTSKDGKHPTKNRETDPRSSLVPKLHSAVHERITEGCKRKFK